MKRILLIILFCIPLSLSAMPNDTNLSLSGFGTFSAAKTDTHIPVIQNREITEDLCFDCDSTVGAQLVWQPNAFFKSGVQVVKRPEDHFSDPEIERAYVEVMWQNSKLTAGRLRVPLFMHSESYFVSSGYPWLRLPAEVYSHTLGITYYTGASYTWNGSIGDSVYYTISPYFSLPREKTVNMYRRNFTFKADGSVGLTTDFYFLDHQLHAAWLNTNAEQSDFGPPSRFNLQLFTLGTSLNFDRLRVDAEVILSDEFHANWYTSLAYNIEKWTPYITYGQGRRTNQSNSYLVGTRYDVTPNINLNLEWQYFHGPDHVITSQFAVPQNPAKPFVTSVNLFSLGLTFTF
ncbi:hypothetical protein [Vibrio sonorensis]|uniref:hypothetical protein n=1 Tax=Vibrio sonorensis TaxID=1004316 RepID=UPI0008DACAA0|nr:hypothetical protein [Vibrio sonorensis]